MRVFAVPSGRFSSAATCSCVRSSRKARLSASRCGTGSSSNAERMMARRRLGRTRIAGRQPVQHQALWVGHDLGLPTPATELVQHAEVRDLEDPRPNRAALGVEAGGVPPDGQEDLLHEVLGSGAVERLSGQPEDQTGEAPVEQGERLGRAPGDPAHQVLVGRGVLRRCHAPVSETARVHRHAVGVRGHALPIPTPAPGIWIGPGSPSESFENGPSASARVRMQDESGSRVSG